MLLMFDGSAGMVLFAGQLATLCLGYFTVGFGGRLVGLNFGFAFFKPGRFFWRQCTGCDALLNALFLFA